MQVKEFIQKFRKQKKYFQFLSISALLALLGFLSVLFLFLLVKWGAIGDIPSKEELLSINNPLSTEIYSKEGKLFGKFYDENRGELTPDDLTKDFKNALLATEDVRFYKHSGLDYRALARVGFKTILLQRDNSGGGSTLTQQLAKNIYKRQRFWALSLVINKFREIATAQKLEKVYSKDEILLLYANTVSFGERAFGLSTASYRFFGKDPSELSLEESATLVGILKAPSYYSPRKNPQRARGRRNTVLAQMHKYNFIDQEAFENAKESELTLEYKSLSETTGLARYFHQFIRKEFELWAKANPKESGDVYDIKRDGLKIHTTLDYNMQIAAEASMQGHMQKLQDIFDRSWKTGSKYGPNEKFYKIELKSNQQYKKLKSEGKTDKEIEAYFDETATGAVWSWKDDQATLTKEDSIKHYLSLLHTGILAAQPSTGAIRAYVGGINFGEFQWDNVMSGHQVGSTFKPIVYLTALEKGVTECDYFPNELRVYSSYKDWTPENSDGKYGGYLSVKEALTRSVNTVSVQMIFKAGIANVIKKARQLGITSNLPEVPSLVLGTADISLFEMVKAYSAIANGGDSPELKGIVRIENAHGEVLYENKEQVEFQESEAFSKLYTIMANVVNEGTAARLYNYDIPFQVMGKTGTTQNQTDGWFIGLTKDLVIGSWVGLQNRGMHFRNLGTGSGGRTALPLVASVFEFAASQNYSPTPLFLDTLTTCPDSIGQEEYAYLQDHPYDFEGLASMNEPTVEDILDGIFRPNRGSRTEKPRSTRKPSRRSKKSRESEFDKFRREVEKDLKNIFKKRKKKKRGRG